MRAFGLDFNARRPAEFALPEPRIVRTDDVLLRVHEVGVCATDRELAEFRFGAPPDGESFLALGHEALAQVLECGPAVATLKPGDWVSPIIRRSCTPACAACLARRRDLCLTDRYLERGIMRLHGYMVPFTVDPAAELTVVPPELVDIAVLLEPLSVVEKAFETALHLHRMEPRRLLIFGAGPVGLLAALAAQARGLECEVVSLEPEDHPKAETARRAGAQYSRSTPSSPADLVFEASGSPVAARMTLDWLKPLGVLILIGASDFDLRFPGLRAVVHNLTLGGIVNAGPVHFEAAVEDLSRFPRAVVERLIERTTASLWRESLGAGDQQAKRVLSFA